MDKDALIRKIRQAQNQGVSEEYRAILDYMAYYHYLDTCRDGEKRRRQDRPCPDSTPTIARYKLD